MAEAACHSCKEKFEVYGELSDYFCERCGYESCNGCTYQIGDKNYCQKCFEASKPKDRG